LAQTCGMYHLTTRTRTNSSPIRLRHIRSAEAAIS
jgi:hypothetical protein